MSDNTNPAKVDGRRLRSDRSRQVIVEAMLQLIDQGNLVPTAQQVADHAKVGIRSVFRHFEDMEAIFATADELWRKEFNHRLQQADEQQPLQQRILGGVVVQEPALRQVGFGRHFLQREVPCTVALNHFCRGDANACAGEFRFHDAPFINRPDGIVM